MPNFLQLLFNSLLNLSFGLPLQKRKQSQTLYVTFSDLSQITQHPLRPVIPRPAIYVTAIFFPILRTYSSPLHTLVQEGYKNMKMQLYRTD
jgi:hypothetical protein